MLAMGGRHGALRPRRWRALRAAHSVAAAQMRSSGTRGLSPGNQLLKRFCTACRVMPDAFARSSKLMPRTSHNRSWRVCAARADLSRASASRTVSVFAFKTFRPSARRSGESEGRSATPKAPALVPDVLVMQPWLHRKSLNSRAFFTPVPVQTGNAYVCGTENKPRRRTGRRGAEDQPGRQGTSWDPPRQTVLELVQDHKCLPTPATLPGDGRRVFCQRSDLRKKA
jgi:hypothetical protein